MGVNGLQRGRKRSHGNDTSIDCLGSYPLDATDHKGVGKWSLNGASAGHSVVEGVEDEALAPPTCASAAPLLMTLPCDDVAVLQDIIVGNYMHVFFTYAVWPDVDARIVFKINMSHEILYRGVHGNVVFSMLDLDRRRVRIRVMADIIILYLFNGNNKDGRRITTRPQKQVLNMLKKVREFIYRQNSQNLKVNLQFFRRTVYRWIINNNQS